MRRILRDAYFRLIGRNSFLVTCLFLVALGLISGGVRRCIENNTNDIKRWLPDSYPETATLQWFQEQFGQGSDKMVIVSWDGASIDDERLRFFAREIRARCEGGEALAEGQPALFQSIVTGPEILSRLTDTPGLALSEQAALERVEGSLIGPQYLHGLLLDEHSEAARIAKVEYGSAAAAEGLLAGDVLTHINGYPTPNYDAAMDLLESLYEASDRGSIAVGVERLPEPVRWSWRGGRPARQAAAVVMLTPLGGEEKQLPKTLAALREIAATRCAAPVETIRLGGPPVDNVEIEAESRRTLFRLAGLSFGVGLLVCYACLKSWRLTFMVFFTALFSEGTSLALVWYTGGKADAILMTMPSLIYVLTISASIHLVNYYKDCVAAGHTDAPQRAAARAFMPCLLSAVTTALGLGSLYISDLTPIRNFGVYSALATLVSLTWVFLFLPSVLTLWPVSAETFRRTGSQGLAAELGGEATRQWFAPLGHAVLRRNKLAFAACLGVMALFAVALPQMRTSVKLMKLFSDEAAIVKDYQWIESKLGPLVPMEVVLHVPSYEALQIADAGRAGAFRLSFIDDLGEAAQTGPIAYHADGPEIQAALRQAGLEGALVRDCSPAGDASLRCFEVLRSQQRGCPPLTALASATTLDTNASVRHAPTMLEALQRVDRVRQAIESLDTVGVTISPVTFAPDLRLSGRFREQRAYVLDRALRQAREDYLTSGYLAAEGREDLYRISLRMGAFDDVDYSQFVEDVRRVVEPALAADDEQAAQAAPIRATYTGVVPLIYKAQNELLRGLIESYGMAFLLIAGVMTFLCWQISGFVKGTLAGPVTMLPNLLPTLMVFGSICWLRGVVDIGTMMTASVALGIAVDDTIHYLAWFHDSQQQGRSRYDSAWRAYQHCAAAMFQTSLVVGLGMGVFAFSSFTPTMKFGLLMLPLLGAALLGDMFMTPAMLAGPLGWLFTRSGRRAEQPAALESGAAGVVRESVASYDLTDEAAAHGHEPDAPSEELVSATRLRGGRSSHGLAGPHHSRDGAAGGRRNAASQG